MQIKILEMISAQYQIDASEEELRKYASLENLDTYIDTTLPADVFMDTVRPCRRFVPPLEIATPFTARNMAEAIISQYNCDFELLTAINFHYKRCLPLRAWDWSKMDAIHIGTDTHLMDHNLRVEDGNHRSLMLSTLILKGEIDARPIPVRQHTVCSHLDIREPDEIVFYASDIFGGRLRRCVMTETDLERISKRVRCREIYRVFTARLTIEQFFDLRVKDYDLMKTLRLSEYIHMPSKKTERLYNPRDPFRDEPVQKGVIPVITLSKRDENGALLWETDGLYWREVAKKVAAKNLSHLDVCIKRHQNGINKSGETTLIVVSFQKQNF